MNSVCDCGTTQCERCRQYMPTCLTLHSDRYDGRICDPNNGFPCVEKEK